MEKSLKNKIFKYLITSVILLALSAYLIYHMFFSSADQIVTEIAYPVTEEISLSCDAYIMKNEYVIRSDSGGISAAYYFDDGTKVPKNALIASLYADESESRGSTLIDIDKRIDFLENSNIDKTYLTSDTSTVDARLSDIYYAIRHGLEEKNITGAISSSDDLLTLLNRRMVITGEINNFDSQIELLMNERSKYANSLGSATSNIYSDYSGYFYSSCDGYEGIFTADRALQMSYDDFIEYTNKSPENTDGGIIGKIAYDYRWYLVCSVTKSDLKNYSVGTSYDIVFGSNSNKKLTLKLVKSVSDTSSDGALLIFESFDSPKDFSFSRVQPVKIIQSSVSGIKVPSAALRIIDGQTGVYILYGSRVYFCTLEILAQNENYYIAAIPDLTKTPYGVLYIYDNIIVSGKDLYEGKVIN